MRNENKTIFINILGSILLQGIAFFTTPIFVRLLGNEQYGTYSVFYAWLSLFTGIMGLGVGNSVAVGIYDFKENYYKFRSSILLLGTFISGIFVVLGIISLPLLEKVTKQSGILVIILLLAAAANYIITSCQSALIYEKKPHLNLILSLISSLTNIFISIFFIYSVIVEKRYLARIYGFALSYIFLAVIVGVLFYLKRPAGLNWEYSKYALKYSLPIIFHSFSYTLLVQSDRIMMQHMKISSADIGVYSVFYTFSSILLTILNTLNSSWCPFYYDDLSKNNKKSLMTRSKSYIELFTVLTIGFILLSKEVGAWFAGIEYNNGLDIIPILVAAVYFTFMYQFLVNYEFFFKKTKVVAIGTTGAAICNIILNYFLIHRIGFYGAAIATTISYFLLFIFHYVVVSRIKKYMFYLKFTDFVPGILAVGLSIFGFYILKDYWIFRWSIGLALGFIELGRIIKRKSFF